MFRILPLFALLIPSAFAQKDFPDGPAKEYINRICLQCHEPGQLLSQHKSENDWRATIQRMSQKGIVAPSEQYDAITTYMIKNFPKRKTPRRSI